MMKFQHFFVFTCLITLFSCNQPSERSGDFNLVPHPQKFDIEGVSDLQQRNIKTYFSPNAELPVLGVPLRGITAAENSAKAQIIYQIDSTLSIPSEGYILQISKKQVSISGKDKAGLFYGFKTLEQLIEDAKEQDVNLPVCHIEDYPLLAYRSIHIDIKHHLEKTDYYYALMDNLAAYKVNGIIVELEDKLKFERRPEIGSEDALSISEWQKLSDYAKERHIEISPLVQGLGHASFILKHDKYADLRDDPESDWAFNPLDPKTYELQFDLYRDAMEATPYGKYLHIGGDEVHTTGRNSGMSSLELQLIWLNKVCDFAAKHNRIPIFWDDMPLKYAGVDRPMYNTKLTQQEVDSIWTENEHKLLGFLDQFPKNCIYMRWNYHSPDALGNIKAMNWFQDHGLQVMGATAGQTRWVLMPQNESNINNIRSFALSSINSNMNGLLLTLWDDDSPHFELYMRGILAFAEYTWAGEKRSKEEIKAAFRHRRYSNKLTPDEFAFIDQLEKPVAFWKNALLQGNMRNYLSKKENPLETAVIEFPDRNNPGAWSEQNAAQLDQAAEMLKTCEVVAKKIKATQEVAVRNSYALEVYEQVTNLAQFSPKALLALKELDMVQTEAAEKAAILKLKELSADFEQLRNRFEETYAKTRILTKPESYILDQDHHVHSANQSKSFDWQFIGEIMFLEKIENLTEAYLMKTEQLAH